MATSNLVFVAAAFAVTWAAMIGYVVHLSRAMRRARALYASAIKPGIK